MRDIYIYPDDNSINIDDGHTNDTFDFIEGENKIKLTSSVNDDVFYNHILFEYKISSEPINIKMRIIEMYHEPPRTHSIKDGVVLESEIKENTVMMVEERIKELKKQVEWTDSPLLHNYALNFYLLSRHPEVVPEAELRKFMRQTSEAIKSAVSKVAEAVKNNELGLITSTTDKGERIIRYPESDTDQKEIDEWISMNEEERKNSAYEKKSNAHEKFCKNLFGSTSKDFVGIPDYAYRESNKIIQFIEDFLNNNPELLIREDEVASNGKSGDKWKWIVLVILSIVALSSGIWTAIGVFVFGLIVISLFRN